MKRNFHMFGRAAVRPPIPSVRARRLFAAPLSAALLYTVFAVIPALILAGCGLGAPQRETVIDRSGARAAVPARIDRIISTAPSNTEIIQGLGRADKLVAIDTFSSGISGIGADLTRIDFSYPDAEVIIGLKPDIIIAAGHNMTVSGEDPFKLIKDTGISVVYIPTSSTIAGIYEDIRFIAKLLGAEAGGEELISGMKAEIDSTAARAGALAEKKSVYLEISPYPYMVSIGKGTYLSEMISVIGADNIFADQRDWFSPAAEAIIERNPDVILTFTGLTADPVADIKSRPGFEHINAVRNGAVYLIDSDAASRPSHNIVIALKQMAAAVYPE
ncbi:MAG: ABC transporter substrate-binding protein [Treponema sp.]|jgi:iron complex transport system substrate-binding protein|nr:ABC transporter substrate-binding protein [Treponema sp.]